MGSLCRIILLTLFVSTIESSIYSNIKDSLISYLKVFTEGQQRSVSEDGDYSERKIYDRGINDDVQGNDIENLPKDVEWQQEKDNNDVAGKNTENYDFLNKFIHQENPLEPKQASKYNLVQWPKEEDDIETAKNKSKILMHAKKESRLWDRDNPLANIGYNDHQEIDRQYFHMDPVLNVLRRHKYRRVDASSSGSSSSRELRDWKTEFKELWMHKKFEALNETKPMGGDHVNMLAARPWGVPCGDPNQHDMPWGNCMLAMECEPEYRVYRGDFMCGRTQFVCCALQLTTYDMYQGFDVSFDSKSLSTDSDEKKTKKTSKENKKKKREKSKRKRSKRRRDRKRKIKRNIRKIVSAIRKILNKQYRNGTKERKRKTKQLKKFVKDLKKQYKKDRKSVKDFHEKFLIAVDARLQVKLNHIKEMNQNFMSNATFRDILVNGTITKEGARMLLEAYPELSSYLDTRRFRRTNQDEDDYLEYDIEYGMLYY